MRLSAKDPYFYMPSISSIKFQVNFPPKGGIMTIQPSLGDALITEFTLSLSGWTDTDLPISYKF